MSRSIWTRLLLVPVLAAIAVSIAPESGSSAVPTPALGLVAVLHKADVTRFGRDTHLYVDSGVYLAATGGAFEIDEYAAPQTAPVLWQVRRDSHGVHQIRQIKPNGHVPAGVGLPRFFDIVVHNSAGKTVSTVRRPFCPGNGYGTSRTDASGPDRSSFPWSCGSELSQATVWGLDEGWAAQVPLDITFPRTAPDGVYSLDVSIDPAYTSQLDIPAGQTSATIQITVTTSTGGFCKPGLPCPPVVDALSRMQARPSTGEGPAVQLAPTGVSATARASGTPDMQALPAHSLSIEHNRDNGRDYLDFGATIWNGGSGPLVVEGFRAGDTPVMTSRQFIYRDGVPVSSQVVGQFEYDTRRGHNHWHMEDIARYDLLNASGTEAVRSGKQSFCLAPTDPIDLTVPGADWQPDQAGLWSACAGESSIWLREVLPAGWGDTYFQSVAGQSFNITKLANGHYKIRVTTDPNNRLIETDYTNNSATLSITLGGTPGHRTVNTVS
jgi:hypothetical protein